ncbi:unnamed protein product [Lymnaea stagnalis]|uniref:C-type lectin domain-containing protein n=1 Tax=Lymnaea stagnalis TaxID=6523 RepID=A0AAV2HY48_LYMST
MTVALSQAHKTVAASQPHKTDLVSATQDRDLVSATQDLCLVSATHGRGGVLSTKQNHFSIALLIVLFTCTPVNGQEDSMCQGVRNGRVAMPTSCHKYYQCKNFKGTEMPCPSGFLFDRMRRSCQRKEYVTCNIITTTPTTLPRAHARCQADADFRNAHFQSPMLFNDKPYYLSKKPFNDDTTSAANCKKLCSRLAVVDGLEEENFVRRLIDTKGVLCILIEGNDKEKLWEWVSAVTLEPLNYIRWAGGQPNGGDQRCLFYERGFNGMLDMPCTRTKWDCHYLCER